MALRTRRQVIQQQGSKARQGRRGGGGGGSVASFIKPHTGKSAGRIANAEAGTEFNPAIRESRQQAKGSLKRQHDVGQWFGKLASDYAGAQTADNAAFKTATDATTKQLADASAAGQSHLQELAGKDASIAALVGGPTDAAGLTKMAEAGSAAERSRAALNAPIAATQAAFISSLGGRTTSARLRGIEARKEEGDRRTKILSDLAAARKEKGQAKVGNMEKIREGDRAQVAQQAQTKLARREAKASEAQAAATQRLAEEEAVRQAREGAITNRQAQERIAISRRNAKTSARSQRATQRHYKHEAGAGGMTPSERRSITAGHKNAAATAHSLVQGSGKGYPTTAQGWAQLEEAVRAEAEVSPAEARAAIAALRKQKGQSLRGLSKDPSPHGLGR